MTCIVSPGGRKITYSRLRITRLRVTRNITLLEQISHGMDFLSLFPFHKTSANSKSLTRNIAQLERIFGPHS